MVEIFLLRVPCLRVQHADHLAHDRRQSRGNALRVPLQKCLVQRPHRLRVACDPLLEPFMDLPHEQIVETAGVDIPPTQVGTSRPKPSKDASGRPVVISTTKESILKKSDDKKEE